MKMNKSKKPTSSPSKYTRIKLNTNDKDIHGSLVRASAKLFKLLETAGDTELRFIWRAALAHKIGFTGTVPIILEDLQKSTTSLKTFKFNIPIMKAAMEQDYARDYKSVSPQEHL